MMKGALSLGRSQYQPTKNRQLSDAQEVHYAKAFKQADIAGNFRQARVRQAESNNK